MKKYLYPALVVLLLTLSLGLETPEAGTVSLPLLGEYGRALKAVNKLLAEGDDVPVVIACMQVRNFSEMMEGNKFNTISLSPHPQPHSH